MEPVRLNKYMTERGIASRRQADLMAEEGRILVNGEKAVPGMKVTDEDEILLDGKPIPREIPERVVLAVHKPVGVVCTARSFRGEENIVDMVGYPARLYPVGRLDKESEGLIFLTNDGTLAKELTDASGRHEKEYVVTVGRELTDTFIKRMEKGVFLEDLNRETAACKIEKTGEKEFRIILVQGLNRQIRRMCEVCGYSVRTLKRVRIMNVLLNDLEAGSYRTLQGEELETLLERLKEDRHRKPSGGHRTQENREESFGGSRKDRTDRSGSPRKDRSERSGKPNGDRSERFGKPDGDRSERFGKPEGKRPAGYTKRERQERFEKSGEAMKPERKHFDRGESSYIPKKSQNSAGRWQGKSETSREGRQDHGERSGGRFQDGTKRSEGRWQGNNRPEGAHQDSRKPEGSWHHDEKRTGNTHHDSRKPEGSWHKRTDRDSTAETKQTETKRTETKQAGDRQTKRVWHRSENWQG